MSKRKQGWLGLLVGLMVLPGMALAADDKPDDAAVLFVSNQEGAQSIYSASLNDGAIVRLTDPAHSDMDPRWSPDRQRIAFVSRRDGNGDIYLMDADGSNQQRLTHSERMDFMPQWHPSGDYLAFTSSRVSPRGVFLLDLATGEARLLSEAVRSPEALRWSPDGGQLAVIARPGGEGGNAIMVIDLEDDGHSILVPNDRHAGNVQSLAWHPSGDYLAYTASTDNRREVQLYVLHVQEGHSEQVASAPGNVRGFPVWSTDGDWLVYASTATPAPEETKTNIYASRFPDDGRPVTVATLDGQLAQPVWLPNDGGEVVFVSQKGGAAELFRGRVDGAEPSLVFAQPAYMHSPRTGQ
ncbi:TolB family protein [Alkalilimnicola ehrlichii MLHE-1]|uniref:WD40 domain protein beta Propeller n=1 Tax=Alkalilimnicola ehrlichii (strain ATCC BAA-1101 / DSM 17681 / MLHE-1) TaxID=187272 RepID=Q0A600_ALKEH|nr:DPP IV N-terminal domain-containing protein [Alkalilimnicola ehrlichii]ABI57737.1 WD40 domain protein beta Propeller [Alkalilimnicola ehrlichii MLHE-1]